MIETPLIRRSPVAMRDCNLAKSFELIGDRWTLLILRSALYGVRRFDDFQTELGVPRSVLSSRLAALVKSGIMERSEYRDEGRRARVEYPLTRMGRTLGLPFFAMTQWADRWIAKRPSPFTLRSKASGQKLSAALVDESGRPVKASDVEGVIDPAYKKPRVRRTK